MLTKKFFNALVLFLFWALALLLYFPARNSMFVYDFIGWIQRYQTEGWGGFIHQFGDKGLHPFYQFFFFSIWKIFGLNSIAWFFIFVSFHVCNAFLTFLFLSNLSAEMKIKGGSSVALFGSFFFLISPYSTEPVVWGATIHYLTTTACGLLILILMLRYLQTGTVCLLICIHVLYFIALFSLEIAFSIPFLVVIIISFLDSDIFKKVSRDSLLVRVVLPFFLWIPVYFLGTKLFLGKWIGHYGAQTHLDFSWGLVVGNLNKYLADFLWFLQYADYERRNVVFTFLERDKIAFIFFLFFAIITSTVFFYRGKISPYIKVNALPFALFLAAMLTTLNLYVVYIVPVEGDRYSYFGSVFLLAMVSGIIHLFPRIIRYFLLATFIFFSIKFQLYNVQSWAINAKVISGLEKSFKWDTASKIYVLNIPDNFRGTYMYRSVLDRSMFALGMKVKYGRNFYDNTRDIMQYNMNSSDDSVTVEKISDNQLKVTLSGVGNWWWIEGKGAYSYSTDDYSVTIDEWNHAYVLTMKKKLPGEVYIYQCSNHWNEVENF